MGASINDLLLSWSHHLYNFKRYQIVHIYNLQWIYFFKWEVIFSQSRILMLGTSCWYSDISYSVCCRCGIIVLSKKFSWVKAISQCKKKKKCKLKQTCMFIVCMFVWNCWSFSCIYTVLVLVKVNLRLYYLILFRWFELLMVYIFVMKPSFIQALYTSVTYLCFVDQHFTFIFNSFWPYYIIHLLGQSNSKFEGKMYSILLKGQRFPCN